MAYIRKRGKTYTITVSSGYDETGKKITRSTTFTPDYLTATGREKAASVIQRKLEEFAAAFEQQVKTGTAPIGGNLRFSELAARYLEEYAALELEAGTADGYRDIIEKRLLPAWGSMKIKDLCQNQLGLQTYFNKITNAQGRPLAPASVRRYMAVMSSVLSWAVDMGLIPSNPMERVKPPKEGFKEPNPKSFTIEELKRFLEALSLPQTATYKAHTRTASTGIVYQVQEYQEQRFLPEQFKLFYLMAAFSGARRGELLALDWSDLDFNAGTVRLYKSLSKTAAGLVIKSTKTASGVRVINMPASVMDLAREWKHHQIEQRLQMGTAWKGKENIFCQADGSRMYPDTVTAKFRDIIRNYNAQCTPADRLPEITLHGLRHTAASILINQHTDIATVSKRLGHSRTSVTLDIYTHAIESADKAAADLLEGLVGDAVTR